MATVPPAPIGYAPTGITQTYMNVNFNSTGTGGSGVIEWQVRWSTNSDGDVETGAHYAEFLDNFDARNLTPYTKYYFWARGRNSVGWGKWSNRVNGTTLPRLPYAPPAPLIDEIDPNQTHFFVLVGDIGPDPEAPVTGYQIGSSTDPNVIQDIHESDGDTTFTKQSWYTLYYYWARIQNAAGWGPWSVRTQSRTKAFPPGTPIAVSVGNETQTSFQYHFDSNGDGGDSNVTWQVGYSTNSSGPTSYINNASGYQTVGGLSRFKTYWVWSRGSNSGGWSAWSAPMSIRTKAYVPAPTTPTSCYATSQTEIFYSFHGNDDGGSGVIEWQIGYGTDPTFVKYTTGSDGSTSISNLRPGTTYYFWSRGRNVEGWSNWSARSQATTISGSRVRYNGAWHQAVPYYRQWSIWNLSQPYVKVNGVWKKTG